MDRNPSIITFTHLTQATVNETPIMGRLLKYVQGVKEDSEGNRRVLVLARLLDGILA